MDQTLDSFLPSLSNTNDTKKRLQIGADLLKYLSIEDNSIECENVSAFIDSIIHWLNNSNFKVAQNGLEVLTHLAMRMKDDLRPYLSSILVPTIDRLGDSRDCVREQAKILLIKLMNFVSTPQIILEKLLPAFSHKNWKVREEICFFFQECLLRFGVVGSTNGQLYVSKFISSLVTLTSDPNLSVRETSMSTLVEIYKHVGDKLRHEILKKHSNMPQQKLQTLLSKFDDIAKAGGGGQEISSSSNFSNFNNSPMVANNNNNSTPTNTIANHNKIVPKSRANLGSNMTTTTINNHATNYNNNNNHIDETDFKKSNSFSKRATSAPPVKRGVPLMMSKLPPSSGNALSKSSGAADEEMFMNLFEEVPRLQIYSVKDLEQELNRIKDVCSNPTSEWEKRIESLRKLRSLLMAGAADYDEFYAFLKPLEVSFQTSVKDLRSQVVREACISIAYLSQRIGNKCDRFAEALLPSLIDTIQNSAKIMSSSAVVAIRFIIQHTHSSRLVPIITYNVSSKSKEIRKTCCEFLDQLLHTWNAHTLERHVGALQEAIKKGISDADPEARAFARKAFWGFADKFKLESDYLLSSLDSSKQRMLQGEQMSNWSSTSSLNKAPSYSTRPHTTARTISSSTTNGSMESLNSQHNRLGQYGMSLSKRSAIPVSSPKTINNHNASGSLNRTPLKATSAIDIDAQRRARAKVNAYLNHHNQQQQSQPKSSQAFLSSVYSLNNKQRLTENYQSATPSIARSTASSSAKKYSRVSKSQPGSRSASPSSRLSYYSSSVASSTANSFKAGRRVINGRETSTIGSYTVGSSSNRTPVYERKLSVGSTSSTSRYNYQNNHHRCLANSDLDLTSQRILQQNDEQLIENAFLMHMSNSTTGHRKKHYDDQSDESETSSICSDTSFANYGIKKMEDISKIIENLSSTNWSDRKDGLLALNNFLRHSDDKLNQFELKRITDIFTRMLVDPHTKAFSLFLNTLNELIHIYKSELNSWLYILMTRLFLKFGSDTLGSIQTRILKTFELIRESFLINHQFDVIMRLLSDQTQTLNTKVRASVLQYLSKLIFLMDSTDFTYTRSNFSDIQTALTKIVSWTADFKSSDLRKISQDTIVDLYSLNSVEMTHYLNGLRKPYQDAAYQIIEHKHKNRFSQPSSAATGTPNLQTPHFIRSMSSVSQQNSANLKTPTSIYDESIIDHHLMMSPDDVYNSLKKTSDEIQKYSFSLVSESSPPFASLPQQTNKNGTHNHALSSNTLYDSNVPSNFNFQNNNHEQSFGHFASSNQNLESHLAHNDFHSNYQIKSTSSTNLTNGHNQSHRNNHDNSLINCFNSLKLTDSEDLDQNQQNLKELLYMLEDAAAERNFSEWPSIYHSLLEKLANESDSRSKVLILRCLSRMLFIVDKKSLDDYIEPTISRLVEIFCQPDSDKEVMKSAEEAANMAAYNFDTKKCFAALKPHLSHEENVRNIISIKILTKMIETCDHDEVIFQLLPEMMSFLLKAYDSPESSVRKASVFCMVAIHGVVDAETMSPYLVNLNPSKMKLLKLYIERSMQQQQQQQQKIGKT